MKIVNAFILQNNKLLTVKRGKEPWKGMYGLPGGHMEEGETQIEALKRELKEETNFLIEVRKSDYLGTGSIPNNPNEVILYRAQIIGGKETPQEDEVEEIKWLAYEEFFANLKQHSFPEGGIQILRYYLDQVKE